MLAPMIPTVVSSWLDVLCVVDHSWHTQETVQCVKPSRVAVHDKNRYTCHLLSYPVEMQISCLAHSLSERHTYTIYVSIVSMIKLLFNLSPPLHLHWLKRIWQVTSIRDHIFHLDSMSQKEQMFLMFCPLSVVVEQGTLQGTLFPLWFTT
jgi:hypothetical protein